MKYWKIVAAALLAAMSLSLAACRLETKKQDNDPTVDDAYVCPLNQQKQSQDYGTTVIVVGRFCTTPEGGAQTCDRRALTQVPSDRAGCYRFQDGAQDGVDIAWQSFCFDAGEEQGVNLAKNPVYSMVMEPANTFECKKAEDKQFYVTCDQFVPDDAEHIQAVLDACLASCGMECVSQSTEIETYCLDVCEPVLAQGTFQHDQCIASCHEEQLNCLANGNACTNSCDADFASATDAAGEQSTYFEMCCGDERTRNALKENQKTCADASDGGD